MRILRILFMFSALTFSESYKILAVFPMPAHSHYTLASKLMKELAKKGHEITLVTPFPQEKPPANIKEVSVEELVPVLNERKSHLYSIEGKTVFASAQFTLNLGYMLTEKVLENKKVQKLLHSGEQYDLVIIQHFLNEALQGIAHHFKAPVVLFSSMPLWSWSSFVLAHPSSSSYAANILTDYTGHMNFWQRFLNSIYDAHSIIYHQWFVLPKHRELVRKYIPGGPDLSRFVNNVSLLLMNTHVSFYDAQPPNIIEIGGLHLEETKKLPNDLQTFLDESDNGVVVFSMGSNLKSSALPDFKRDAILKAFSKLKQNVLWKWEEDELPGQPKNVKLMKWLPQSDVLAHPNVKVFITHGGLLSTIESIHHGVPTIGIPVFADQKMNIASAVSRGYALVVPFQELTEEKLSYALNEILGDRKYKENAVKRSRILRDRPVKPMESALYWIEYVIRHRGASHLRYPGMDLWWYQRNLLDVVAFVVLTGIAASLGIKVTVKIICRRFKIRDGVKKNN